MRGMTELRAKALEAKEVSKRFALFSTEVRNKALKNIANRLLEKRGEILSENEKDLEEAKEGGMSEAMLDRLLLNSQRISEMSQGVLNVAALPDPVGEIFDMRTLPNGLQVGRKRVPLGVIGTIYESRPNVTVDISSLCLKSGNAVILRGGKEAIRSNGALAQAIREAIAEVGVPHGTVQFIESPARALVEEMLKMNDLIDLIVPRGGEGLIRMVEEKAAMPAVAGGIGVCHTYVDKAADLDKAAAISANAKVQRPTVCNALDTLLVHSSIAERFLPLLAKEWAKAGVEMHCDERSFKILSKVPKISVIPAEDADWGKEFLSLKAAIRLVDSLEEALSHIENYGSGHSEAIVTEDYSAGMRFLNEVDAACVYVNASTRFTDGGQFGLGAEVGISTKKFHARGPMGLKELTSYKWIILGSGQVRP